VTDRRWDPDGAQERMTSLEKYALGFMASFHEEHDMDNTMQLAITRQELAFITFACFVCMRMFPELGGKAMRLQLRLLELSEAQDFLPFKNRDDDV
jgi:hypothetical protein